MHAQPRGEPQSPQAIAALCKLFQEGDAAALEQLCRIYEQPLLRFLYFLTRSQDAAADLAQETWLQAITKKDSLRDPSKFKSWLFRIAQRRFYMSIRGSKHEAAPCPEEVPGDEPPLDEIVIREEEQVAALAALEALPPDRKALVWLVVAEECSHAEASAILDIPEGTARSRLHYALKDLRKALSRKDRQ